MRDAVPKLRPEAPNSETAFANVYVVKYDHAAFGKALTPRLVVLPDGLIIVLAVNVQHIHGASSEIGTGILKAGPQQSRKSTKLGFVEGSNIGEYFFSVEPSVFVAQPGIDGKARPVPPWVAIP